MGVKFYRGSCASRIGIVLVALAMGAPAQARGVSGLRGRVVDERLLPIAGACLRFAGEPPRTGPMGCCGAITFAPVPVRTQADGRFCGVRLPSEYAYVTVEVAGRPCVREMFRLRNECWLDLRVDRGVTVAGVVRDERGLPVRGASVATQSPDAALRLSCTSEDDGRFLIEGVPAGSVQLRAWRGEAEATRPLLAEDGELAAWDPVLARREPGERAGAREFRGVLSAIDGSPLANWSVEVRGAAARNAHHAATDARGCFSFEAAPNVAPQICRLLATRVAGEVTFPMLAAECVLDASVAEPLLLRMRTTDEPTARVRGAIRNARGNAHPDLVLRVSHRLWKLETDVNAVTGSFQTQPIPEGRYRLEVLEREHALLRPCLQLGTRIVERGRDLDLGEVRAPW